MGLETAIAPELAWIFVAIVGTCFMVLVGMLLVLAIVVLQWKEMRNGRGATGQGVAGSRPRGNPGLYVVGGRDELHCREEKKGPDELGS